MYVKVVPPALIVLWWELLISSQHGVFNPWVLDCIWGKVLCLLTFYSLCKLCHWVPEHLWRGGAQGCNPSPAFRAAIESKWELWVPADTSRAVFQFNPMTSVQNTWTILEHMFFCRLAQNMLFQKKKKNPSGCQCLDTTDMNLKAFQVTSQPDILRKRSELGRGQMAGTSTTHLWVCGMPPTGPEWQTVLICYLPCTVSSFCFRGSWFSSCILSK